MIHYRNLLKKKLLILGMSGLTGYKIAKITGKKYDVYGTFNERNVDLPNCTDLKLDVTKEEEVKIVFSEIKPDLVINTTALHNVDLCEQNQDRALLVNKKAVQILFENSEKHGSKFVHISTDYVFDGNSSTPYAENDEAIPVNVYGNSKLEG